MSTHEVLEQNPSSKFQHCRFYHHFEFKAGRLEIEAMFGINEIIFDVDIRYGVVSGVTSGETL